MAFAKIGTRDVLAARLMVGQAGPWVAEVELDGETALSGQVSLELGATSLVGTVDARQAGAFAGRYRCRIVAGSHGWAQYVTARHYHNDARVKARTIADDAAREVGETIGTFAPAAERVGIDYVRRVGTASQVLDDASGGVTWWVDYAGVTHVGERALSAPKDGAYEVLGFDPSERILQLGVSDASTIVIGSQISRDLSETLVVRELELVVDGAGVAATAWCDASATTPGRFAETMRAIIGRVDSRLWGKYRYRVVRMAGERVECQAVRKGAGLPDVLPVSMWPGVAGAHASLTPGSEVLVEFVEGDRTMPIVVGFVGRDGQGHVPVLLELGGSGGQEVARKGDTVEVLLPPAVFSGTIGGTPATGVITFTLNKTSGTITTGSSKVKVVT